jgi:serine/threonine-protein kinase
MAAQLNHPNIVPIYSVDERDGIVYFVMALVEGDNLAVRLHKEGSLHPGEARRILQDVAGALAYAHERNVVHRDIKPDNILIQADDGRVLVTDFGIARAVSEGADSRLTATGMAIGTPAYMSPEQSTGEREIDGRSDLYSLGIVGYQMLTGDPPFEAPSTPALLVKHLSERPDPISDRRRGVPPDLERAVMLMLEKDPDDRFPSAAALVTALETGNVPQLPVPSARPTSLPRVSRRAAEAAHYEPIDEDVAKWDDPRVRKFRSQLGPYVIINSAIILVSILFGASLGFITAIWSVVMAFRYAKLWSDGLDWHHVLREPRDRMFLDVVAEWFDNVRAVWDKDKRTEVRERSKAKADYQVAATQGRRQVGAQGARRLAGSNPRGARPRGKLGTAGLEAVRKADEHRQDIMRWVGTLSKRDRTVVEEVPATAQALFDRIEALAVAVSELDREVAPGSAEAVEGEISALEAQANPFDHRASEDRVRRLAHLKRQRQVVNDIEKRRERSRAALDECLLHLENMRYDVIKLRAGSPTLQHITQVAERAKEIANEVETARYVQDEMAKLKGGRRESGIGQR